MSEDIKTVPGTIPAHAAVDFLRRFHGDVPWNVVAINPDRKGAVGRTFPPEAERDGMIAAWVAEHAGDNCYFSAAEPRADAPNKKLDRADVVRIRYVFADVDPRAGEDLGAEGGRIITRLRSFRIPPTGITNSGRGFQAFWALAEPVELDGEGGPRTLAFEARCRALEHELEGDLGVWNCDRILRLPGTTNWPDARKRKKNPGIQPASTSVVEWHPERVYRLEDLPAMEAIGLPKAKLASGIIADTVDLRMCADLSGIDDPRLAALGDRWKALAASGPDTGDREYSSRSEWQLAVSCEMVRRGIPDDVHVAVLMNPDWAIHETIAAHGGLRYAERQVQRAHDMATDPDLAEMNERFTLASIGGKVRVLSTRPAVVPGTRIVAPKTEVLVVDGFSLLNNQRQHTWTDDDGKPHSKPIGEWWLQARGRATAHSVGFSPSGGGSEDFNLWHGFAVEPREGDCEPFLDFMRRRTCNGRQDVYEYLLNWLALAVQRPGEPGQTIPILFSKETGTGKNAWADLGLGLIFGHNFLYVSHAEHLTGKFSGHLATTVALHLGEASIRSREDFEGALKALATDRTRMAELKGLDGFGVANCLHVLFSSNLEWILKVAPEDRRFCVVEVSGEKMPKREYDELRRFMESEGGAGRLLHMLLRRDISGFDVFDRPTSCAYERQIERSRDAFAEWAIGLAEEGALPNTVAKNQGNITRGCLEGIEAPNGLWEHARRVVPKLKLESDKRLAAFLADLGVEPCKDGDGRRCRRFPPLAEFRRILADRYRSAKWDDTAEWSSEPF